MQKTENHAMQLLNTHPTGAEEWYCPTCGRRFVMQWPPSYKRIVLVAGDEVANHTAVKGGLKFNAVTIHNPDGETNVEEGPTIDDLSVWLDDLDDFDSWWDRPLQ